MFFSNAVLHIGLIGFVALLLIGAAISDATRYRIPNVTSLGIVFLFPLFVFSAPGSFPWIYHLGVGVFVFGVGYAMYAKKLAGAGDIKLMTAVSLWAGPANVGVFLLISALSGGLLGLLLAALVFLHDKNLPVDQRRSLRKVPIPYGVALAIGGLAALWQMASPYLFPA